ncbi:MAG: hypothetical protein Tp178DCM178821_46 [Prokaryotic dsDNA virus sp.]|nr:MAG: hypothetical protein Tp178DCM178821_46 [Prokaryotic dsDNA virus sp.]|tara:strand:+ start:217 stop:585 length:369 start_codon:yes stop_codon:yes gene_type:complete
MKLLKDETTKELAKKLYDIINRVNIELNFNTTAETMVGQAKILTNDLITIRRFNKLTFEQIRDAFYEGVRDDDKDKFMSIPTYFKWIKRHKKRINEAINKVEYLKEDVKQVDYYPKHLKLLK